MHQLDHVVLATPDLGRAKREFEAQTGTAPQDGGPHAGMGTRNALIGIDDAAYIEIIAPDPDQPAADNFGARLARLPQMELLHWAVRVTDLDAVAARVRSAGLSPLPVRHMTRKRTDGKVLRWSVLGIRGHDLGGLIPFYIDWEDSPHPAVDAVRVRGATFDVTLPRPGPVELLSPAPDGVRLGSDTVGMQLSIATPSGSVTFRSARPAGFGF